ncbi:MAG: right-handed parallel beta-helix repeat-containing protein, partial [Armatimonadetes bacterium]|nr:right-handed parallel beta-helix repeat-containing protein [Armatimonadota bacterium]
MRWVVTSARRALITTPWLILAISVAWGSTVVVEGFDSGAIGRAIENSHDGDVVMLPAGTYTITEAIRPKSNTTLAGAEDGQTILMFGGDAVGPFISLRGCENVTVHHLLLEGNMNPNCSGGVLASDSRGLNVHHLMIRNLGQSPGFGPFGIRFAGQDPTRKKGVTDSVISDCIIENIGVGKSFASGIRLSWGSSRNRVLRCTIRNTGRGGIHADNGSTDLVIRGNTVERSGGTALGIELWTQCHRCVVEDNRIDHWLSLDTSDYCAVRRNVIGTRDGTFAFIGIELISSYCVLTDNRVDDGQVIGLSESGPVPKQYVFWGNNTFKSCSQWAAQLQGEKGGVSRQYFWRCRFMDTTTGRGTVWYPNDAGHGLRTNGNCRDLVFERCKITGNAGYGIQLGGPDIDSLSFIGCVVKDNNGSAVVGPGAYTALEWQDCTVAGNGADIAPAAKPFPTAPPVAALDIPDEVTVGETVRLVSRSQGEIEKALWDFDDGIPAVGHKVTHVYERAGDYRITVVVWDRFGRAARCSKRLKVVSGPCHALPPTSSTLLPLASQQPSLGHCAPVGVSNSSASKSKLPTSYPLLCIAKPPTHGTPFSTDCRATGGEHQAAAASPGWPEGWPRAPLLITVWQSSWTSSCGPHI